MAPHDSQPWNPDRGWADPFIAILLLATLWLAGAHLRPGPARTQAPATQASLQGRLLDVLLGGSASLARQVPLEGWYRPRALAAGLASATEAGWDQAVLAVHAAEAKDLEAGRRLIQAAPGPEGASFRQAWSWAYLGTGSAPGPGALPAVAAALGNGYSALILEARVQARQGADPQALEQRARSWAEARLLVLILAGLAGVLVAGAGLAYGLFLALTPAPPVTLPHFGLSGRALLIVLLGWFLTFLTAGAAVALLLRPFPWLKPVQLPLIYGLHAGLGTAYLCRAEGISLGTLWRRVAPGRPGPALATGLGFFALAFAAVLAVSLVLGPLIGKGEPPQRQLFELLAGLKQRWTILLMFATVAGLAPAFEELMFRGFLLPWLGERLAGRNPRRGWLQAVAITGLGFGAMHLQPLGLPTLTTLGLVLGLAFVRTGNLATSILVHGLWNGGVFLLLRTL